MIKLQNISVTFNPNTPLSHPIFKRLNLSIFPQDFVTIMGGNGSGKSSLLNLISGEIKPEKGKILLDNQDITYQKSHERAGLISRVFQDPLLGSYADLTLEENLTIALFRGKKRTLKFALSTHNRQIFQEKLSEIGLGLENRLHDKMGLFSGGQRQAISLIMATLQPSKILLLDEHTAALDPKMEQSILMLTQKLIEEKKLTALMITHNMSQALTFGNRILLMHQGQIVKDLKNDEKEKLKTSDLLELL
jgi:putative ABC transport system ATP-binding protein